ncbi:MAG TPA: CopG family ribbon-helix-helix protein [Stellaceae bacterium]|nr:CopG family ribbon-helix-helix protein [Stellaceae bacterium]
MAKSRSLSVRLDQELDARLSSVAENLHRPRSWVVEQAIKEFLDLQAWHLAAIEEGIRDADAGRLVSHEDVVAWVESWGTSNELSMPECK